MSKANKYRSPDLIRCPFPKRWMDPAPVFTGVKVSPGTKLVWGAIFSLALVLLPNVPSAAHIPTNSCQPISYAGNKYTVCEFDTKTDDVRFFLNRPNGTKLGNFSALNNQLETKGENLAFAMNGGMYHDDRNPVGVFRAGGKQTGSVQTRASNDNFGMLPNGVFWLDGNTAGVTESKAFKRSKASPDNATQSGPMLVINGRLHPKFRAASKSKRVRNGVGVKPDARTMVFVISERPVNFHTFATLFQKHLETPNALYLDGVVSKLYAPNLNRNDTGLPMGPIIGVVRKSEPKRLRRYDSK